MGDQCKIKADGARSCRRERGTSHCNYLYFVARELKEVHAQFKVRQRHKVKLKSSFYKRHNTKSSFNLLHVKLYHINLVLFTGHSANERIREDSGRGEAPGRQVLVRQAFPNPQDRRGQIQGKQRLRAVLAAASESITCICEWEYINANSFSAESFLWEWEQCESCPKT